MPAGWYLIGRQQTAMANLGAYAPAELGRQAPEHEFGVTWHPTWDGTRKQQVTTFINMIPKGAKHIDAAWKLAEFLATSPEAQTLIFGTTGFFGPSREFIQGSRFDDPLTRWYIASLSHAESVRFEKHNPYGEGVPNVWNHLVRARNAVLIDQEPSSIALERANDDGGQISFALWRTNKTNRKSIVRSHGQKAPGNRGSLPPRSVLSCTCRMAGCAVHNANRAAVPQPVPKEEQAVPRVELDNIFAPVVTGVPPSNAFRNLIRLPDGTIRCYGYRGTVREPHPLYIESRDNGLTWQSQELDPGFILTDKPTVDEVVSPSPGVPSPYSGDYYFLWSGPGVPLSVYRSTTGIDGPYHARQIDHRLAGMMRLPLSCGAASGSSSPRTCTATTASTGRPWPFPTTTATRGGSGRLKP